MAEPAEAIGTDGGRRRRRRGGEADGPKRPVDYRNLTHAFDPIPAYSEDQIEEIHRAALKVLREIGVKILLPRAQEILRAAGCDVDEDGVARYPEEVVEAAIASSPSEFRLHGADAASSPIMGGRNLLFTSVGGAPHINDLDLGKRPGALEHYENIVKLNQFYDVIHIQTPNVEPQDLPTHVRHYPVTRAQLVYSTKTPFVYLRGSEQVSDCLEMIRIYRGVSKEEFRSAAYCWTVMNTNSPLILDMPMLQGLLDFAEAGQPVAITPFTLSGAMAPATIPGALVQQHAEMLSALVVSQQVRPGAPIIYGGFTSNVDMKSGAPAFGTPEYFRAALATGQLARRVRLPWRSSAPNASNCVDAQAVYETQFSLWGAILGGANIVLHAAGWLEGGLTASMEKFIVDVEMLRNVAEMMQPAPFDADQLAWEAISEVRQGGHFFGATHTMERYQTAFYAPYLSDWSNFGAWTEKGAKTATERANEVWKREIANFTPPPADPERVAALDAFIARRTAEGGAPPVS